MTDHALLMLLGIIGGACLVAAIFGHRVGNDRRDVRLMALLGSTLGSAALALLSVVRI